MNKTEKTLIYKDLLEVIKNEKILLPMIAFPIIMIVLIPLVLIFGAKYIMSDAIVMNQLQLLIQNMPTEYNGYDSGQLILTIMTNYMFPSLFLIIPIMSSGVMGASSLVGEKEHKTMETLLYTPITVSQLFRAKIMAVFITSYGITLLSFLLFGIIMNIGGLIYFKELIFPNVKWLIILFWIAPAINFLSITITSTISATTKSSQEAQQLSQFINIPIFFGLVGQMSGTNMPNNTAMFVFGIIVFIIDFLLIKKASKKFIVERLIS